MKKIRKTSAIVLITAIIAILTIPPSNAFAITETGIQTSEGDTLYPSANPVVVDSGLTVAGDTINGAKVMIDTMYSGDVLSYSSGSLPSGVSASWNSSTGVLSFTGSATAANWQTLLRTVTFTTTSTITATRSISFSLGSAISYNNHYYEYVPATVNWTTAYSLAQSRTYFGMPGYLATITSAGENQFIFDKLQSDAWIGATDDGYYTGDAEGRWYWVTGPEAGVLFSIGNNYPSSYLGRYMNWNYLEPNDSGGEDYGEIYCSNNGGKWNDLNNSHGLGYVVEYGGLGEDPLVDFSAQKSISIVSYNISYALDGGTNYLGAPTSYTTLSNTIYLGTPTKTGYNFAGWYDAATGGTQITQITKGSSGNVTLYARWTIKQFTVTFKNYDGSILKNEIVNYHSSATPPTDPERTGYTFDAWSGTYTNIEASQTVTATYTANTNTAYTVKHYQQDVVGDGYTLKETENLTGTTDETATAEAKTYTGFSENTTHASRTASGNIEPNGSLVLSLYYDRNEYTVTFKDHDDSTLKTETVRYDGTATPPTDPTRTGYTFDAWSGTYTNIEASQTVTATYTANTNTAYTVKHYQQDVVGDGYTLKETENLTGTTDTTIAAVAKTYTGFSENTTHASRAASGNIEPDGSLVLSLYYDRNEYTVTFKDHDDSTLKTETVRYDGTATPPTDPTRTGYTFDAWSGTYTNIEASQTVTATYTANTNTAYTVKHYQQDVVGDGYTLKETENLTGTTDTTIAAVAKTYTGFSENTTHESQTASGNIEPDGSLVLSLYYDRNEYTVTFKDHDDSTLKTETVRYDGTATPPTDPTRTGYTFDAWSGPYTNIGSSQTVTATYTANTNTAYTVKHYQQDVVGDGYTLKATENLTGTTDTTIAAVAKTYTGFSENTTHASRTASGNIEPDGSLVLSLYYDRNEYTVTFEDYDDGTLKTETVRYEATATPPTDPEREGYRFVNWYKDESFENIWDFSNDVMPASDVTLYAKWILTPEAPELLEKTATTIELVSNIEDNLEYRIGGGDWQESALFEGLTPDTEYKLETRIPANETDPASYASETTVIRTNKIYLEDPSDGNNIAGVDGNSFDPETEPNIECVNNLISTEGSAANKVNIELANEEKTIAALYNIELMLNGESIQPNGMIRISLKLSSQLKAVSDQLKIYYISDDGDYEIIPHEIVGDYIVFEIDHLSTYAIIAPQKALLPATGENNQDIILFGFELILAAAVMLIIQKKIKNATVNDN